MKKKTLNERVCPNFWLVVYEYIDILKPPQQALHKWLEWVKKYNVTLFLTKHHHVDIVSVL